MTAIASGGRAGPKAVGTERVPQRSAASEAARAESVVAGAVAAAEVAAVAAEGSSQGGRPEQSGAADHKNVSPDVEDLLEVAAVQAAVDAIVDAALRGVSTDPDNEFE